MLRFQIALAVILISCVAFVSCDRAQQVLEPVADDMMDTPGDMPTDMMPMMDMTMHKSWMHVMLPAPTMTVEEAAAAMNPGGTGAAHGMGTRTVYFNEAGATANMAGTAYPAGTMIVKDVMDITDTFIMQRVTMMKTDDPMYAAHNGWIYGATQRESETEELMMPHQLTVEMAMGCHGCHAKASDDSVFVSLSMDMMDDDGMMEEGMDDGMMEEGMDDGMMDDDGMDDDAGAGDAQ